MGVGRIRRSACSVVLLCLAFGSIPLAASVRLLSPQTGDTVDRSYVQVDAVGNFPVETVISAWLLVDGHRWIPLQMQRRIGRTWRFTGGSPLDGIPNKSVKLSVEIEVRPPDRSIERHRAEAVTVNLSSVLWPIEGGSVFRSATAVPEGAVSIPESPEWVIPVQGEIQSQVVANGEFFFVPVCDSAETRISAIDLMSGKVGWTNKISGGSPESMAPRVTELALSADGAWLFALTDDSGESEIRAFDAADGSKLWTGTNMPFVRPPSVLPAPAPDDPRAVLLSGFEEPNLGRPEFVIYRVSSSGLILEAARVPVQLQLTALPNRRSSLAFLGYVEASDNIAYVSLIGEHLMLFTPEDHDGVLLAVERVEIDRTTSAGGEFSPYLVSNRSVEEHWSGFVYNNRYYALEPTFRRLVPDRIEGHFSIRTSNFALWNDRWVVFSHRSGGYWVSVFDKLGFEVASGRLSREEDYGEEYFVQAFDTQPILFGDRLLAVDRNYDLFVVNLQKLVDHDPAFLNRVAAPQSVKEGKKAAGMLPFGSETDPVTGRYYQQPTSILADGRMIVLTGERAPNFIMSYRLSQK